MYVIKNSQDNAILSRENGCIGFYFEDKGNKQPLRFENKRQALTEASKWKISGMFPIIPIVKLEK